MIKKITCSIVSVKCQNVWSRKPVYETSYELTCVDCGNQLSIMSVYKAKAIQRIEDMGWRSHEDMGDMCPDCLSKHYITSDDPPENPEVSE